MAALADHNARILSYQALADATNGFEDRRIVGRGGFGPVYRGDLDNIGPVAVKVLEAAGGQGVHEFHREVEILSRCRHENIVPLLACAMTPGHPLCLAYAYMADGALSDALLRNPRALSADQRLRVAEDIARGLAYLHAEHVVHRDIKSANILLDGEGRARVADAGLARDVNAQTTTMTRGLAVGSPGYLDPEYAETYRVTTASDVYSYGVVLLELLTGLSAFDPNQQPPPLASRLRRHLPDVDAAEVFRGVGAALRTALGTLARRCIARESGGRPTAAEVLQEFASMRAAGVMQPPRAPRERECVVCLDAPINTRLLPCRHSTVCEVCAAETLGRGDGCPLCRVTVEEFEVGEFPVTFETEAAEAERRRLADEAAEAAEAAAAAAEAERWRQAAAAENVQTLEGHRFGVRRTVWGVAVSADGRRVVSASADNTLKVWDVNDGEWECVATLEGHANSVHDVAVSADGQRVVSGSKDNTLKVWDVNDGEWECVATLEGHSEQVWGVAVSQDGLRVVSGSYDSTLKVWDVNNGEWECMATLRGHSNGVWGVAVFPDGRHVVSASLDKTLKVWDVATGECVATLEGHSNRVYGVAVFPDGRRVVSGSSDKTLKLFAC